MGNFTYGYDGLGRMTSYTTPLGAARWEYEAAPTGRVQRQLLPNGAYTAYTYTAKGQLQSQTNLWDNGTPDLFTDDILLSAFTIPATNGYDAAGRLLTLQVNIPNHPELSGTKTFQYYADGKLQQETFTPDQGTGYTHTFTYDNAGNPTILRGTTTNREYNAANQLTGWYHDGQWQRGTAYFAYDDRGNPTTYKGDTLTYDPEGRLTQYGTALTAEYDSDGVRVWKDVGGQRTYFIDGGEMDAAGNVTATDVFGPTGLLARQTIQGQTSTTVFYLFDPLGNVVQRLDATGAVLSVEAYDAWGAQLAGAGDDPYGYKGQVGYYTDAETGLILCTHRYYDPATGRWVNRDPIGYDGGINLYGYCGGDPVNGVDPSGYDGFMVSGSGNPNFDQEVAMNPYGLCADAAYPNTTNAQYYYIMVNSDPRWRDDVAALERTSIATIFLAAAAGIARAAANIKNLFPQRPTSPPAPAAKAPAPAPNTPAKVPTNNTGFIATYWNKVITFKNMKVYQRDSLIDFTAVDKYGNTSLQRMEMGYAPLGYDGKPIVLHHMTQQNCGPVVELSSTFHSSNGKVISINPNTIPSGINRNAFDKWREAYWINRYNDFTK